MKIAVLSESPADEAAIKILVDGVLGRETQVVSSARFRPADWPAVINILPTFLKFLHYQTEADALAVVVDSDDSPVHQRSHEDIAGGDSHCRLCLLRNIADTELSRLPSISGRNRIKAACGLAVPAIEAWYQCGLDPHVNEATWARKLQSETITYTRSTLKISVYGTDRPSIDIEKACAIKAAERLTDNLSMLERLFPDGFGTFARDVRNW